MQNSRQGFTDVQAIQNLIKLTSQSSQDYFHPQKPISTVLPRLATGEDEEAAREGNGGSEVKEDGAKQEDESIWETGEVKSAMCEVMKTKQEDGRTIPAFEIMYQTESSLGSTFTNRCEFPRKMVVKVKLTGEEMSNVTVDVKKNSILVSSPSYHLATYLPRAVDATATQGTAEWHKQRQELVVTMPCLPRGL